METAATAVAHIPVAAQQTLLPVMEHFYTLQGEGFYTGHAAWFLRLGGCDVGCVWCDVKESWDANAHPSFSIEAILGKLEAETAFLQGPQKPIVVVTGGEPLLHNLDALTAALQQRGYRTNIETSGSSPLSGSWNWICLSPKKFKSPLPEVAARAHELKVVVYNDHDFKWAEHWAAQVGPQCRLYLAAEWSRRETVYPKVVDYILRHPQWQLSVQTHKYVHIP